MRFLKFWVLDVIEGKREAEQKLEKQVIAKKQKRDEGVQQAVVKQKVEAKTQKKNKVESSDSEEDSSESEEEEVIFSFIVLVFVNCFFA
jgi:nucleolin